MDPDVAGMFPVVIVAHVPNVTTQDQIILRDNCQFIAEDAVGIPICKQSEFCLFAFSLNVPKWSAFDVRLEIITTAQDSSLESCAGHASGDCGANGRNTRVEMTGRTLRVDCTWAVAFIQWSKPFQKLLKTGSSFSSGVLFVGKYPVHRFPYGTNFGVRTAAKRWTVDSKSSNSVKFPSESAMFWSWVSVDSVWTEYKMVGSVSDGPLKQSVNFWEPFPFINKLMNAVNENNECKILYSEWSITGRDEYTNLSFNRSEQAQQRQPTEIPVQTNLDSSNKTWLKFLQYVNVTKSDSSVLPLEASRLLSNPGLLCSDDLMFVTSDNVQQFKEKVVMLDEKSDVTLLGQLKAGIVLDSTKDYEKARELNMLFFNISDLTGKKLDQSSETSQETKCTDTKHEIKSNHCADAQETKCNLTAEVVPCVDCGVKFTQRTELDHSTELLQETKDCSIKKIELNSYNDGIEADSIPNHSIRLVDWLDPKKLWAPHCPSEETENVEGKQRCSAQDSRDEVTVDELRFSKLLSENFFFSDDQELVDPKELENNSVYVPYMNKDEDFNAAYPPSDDIDEFRSIDTTASRLPELNGDDAKFKDYSVPYEYMRDDWLEEEEIVFKLNDGSRQEYNSSMENGCVDSRGTEFTNLRDVGMVSVAEYNTWINRNQSLADDDDLGKLSSDALGLCRDRSINAVPVIRGESPKLDLESVNEVDIELVASQVRCSNFECEPVGKYEYIDAATDSNADPNYDQEYKEFENFINLIEKESRFCFSDDLENTLQNSAQAISKSTQTLPSLARNSRDLTDAATPLVVLGEGEIDMSIICGYDARKIYDQEHSSKMLSESGDAGCHENKRDEVQDAICGSNLEYNDVEMSQVFHLNDEELSCRQNIDPGNSSEIEFADGNRADVLLIENGSEVINECNVKNYGDEYGKKISGDEGGTPFSSFSQYMDCSSELNDTLDDLNESYVAAIGEETIVEKTTFENRDLTADDGYMERNNMEMWYYRLDWSGDGESGGKPPSPFASDWNEPNDNDFDLNSAEFQEVLKEKTNALRCLYEDVNSELNDCNDEAGAAMLMMSKRTEMYSVLGKTTRQEIANHQFDLYNTDGSETDGAAIRPCDPSKYYSIQHGDPVVCNVDINSAIDARNQDPQLVDEELSECTKDMELVTEDIIKTTQDPQLVDEELSKCTKDMELVTEDIIKTTQDPQLVDEELSKCTKDMELITEDIIKISQDPQLVDEELSKCTKDMELVTEDIIKTTQDPQLVDEELSKCTKDMELVTEDIIKISQDPQLVDEELSKCTKDMELVTEDIIKTTQDPQLVDEELSKCTKDMELVTEDIIKTTQDPQLVDEELSKCTKDMELITEDIIKTTQDPQLVDEELSKCTKDMELVTEGIIKTTQDPKLIPENVLNSTQEGFLDQSQ